MSKAGRKKKTTMHCLLALPIKKGQKKQFKGRCGYCGEIGHKAANCPDKKSKKKRTLKTNPTKRRRKNLKRIKVKGKTNITKIKCYNCEEMGHFVWDCPKPCKHANLARENEQNKKFAEILDLGDSSVCKECVMICTDAYSDEEYEEMVVYRDQGITSKTFDKETYGDFVEKLQLSLFLISWSQGILNASCSPGIQTI